MKDLLTTVGGIMNENEINIIAVHFETRSPHGILNSITLSDNVK